MKIWHILGIDETKDKEEIKKAYRTRLTKVNPEDDPKGFMELRAAYEEAVRLADAKEEKTPELSPVAKMVDELYSDYNRRVEADEWRALFDHDLFVALDTSEDSFRELMRYLLDHFMLSHEVWQVIVERFDVNARKKELSEIFPENFLDYMINNAIYDDPIDHKLFEGDVSQFDDYLDCYMKADSALRRHDTEEVERLLDELAEFDVSHPYADLFRNRFLLSKFVDQYSEDAREAGEEAKLQLAEIKANNTLLLADLPEDYHVLLQAGFIARVEGDYDAAKEFYEKVLSVSEDNYQARCELAELLYLTGEYEKSRDAFIDLLKENHYDNGIRAAMIRANQALIDSYKKKIEEDPSDDDTRLEMGWSYYQSYAFQDGIDILESFRPKPEKYCEYYNVKGRTFLCLSRYEEAIECFKLWKAAIEAIPEDADDEDSLKKKKRYGYVNFLLGDCYLKLKDFGPAREYIMKAKSIPHEEEILTYESICELEYECGNYDACIRACDELNEKDDRSYLSYDYMSKACYAQGYYREAVSAAEHAISIYPFVAETYGLLIRIYLRAKEPDLARQVLDRFRSYEVESDCMDYHEALILEYEGKKEELVDLLQKTLERGTIADTDIEDYAYIYMILGRTYASLGDHPKALLAYEKAVEINPDHATAHGRYGVELRMASRYEEALREINIQLEREPDSPYYYVNRGMLMQALGSSKDSIRDFEEALKYEPENAYCHYKIGYTLESENAFEEALTHYDQAIAITDPYWEDERKDSMIAKGRVLQCLMRFDEANELYAAYEKEYGLASDMVDDWSTLLSRENRLNEAIDLLKRGIDALPDDAQSLIYSMICIAGRSDYIGVAREAAELGLERIPNDPYVYANLASILRELEENAEAKKYFEKAVEFDEGMKENLYPELVEVMYVLSKPLVFKPTKLIEQAMKAKEKRETPHNLLKLAKLYRVLKKTDEALAVCKKALAVKRCRDCVYGRCHEIIYQKGLIYESIKDYKTAYECYAEALRICGRNQTYENAMQRVSRKIK